MRSSRVLSQRVRWSLKGGVSDSSSSGTSRHRPESARSADGGIGDDDDDALLCIRVRLFPRFPLATLRSSVAVLFALDILVSRLEERVMVILRPFDCYWLCPGSEGNSDELLLLPLEGDVGGGARSLPGSLDPCTCTHMRHAAL